MRENSLWLAGQFAARMAMAYRGLTNAPLQLETKPSLLKTAREGDMICKEVVLPFAAGALWILVPEATWTRLGRLILKAAGLDEITDDDARSSFQELLQQSVSPLAELISTRLGREVSVGGGEETQEAPPSVEWCEITVSAGQERLEPVLFAPDNALLDLLEPAAGLAVSMANPIRENRNLELLMEVEMPVSVSFGRTRMRLKDAVKLTTGSIVELNRGVAEPVEMIVNNCVIARGEVVVVDGNYGIRISHVISREERLRTLF
jgi:flagellar motor switch protein FliN/FliY